MRSRSRFFYLIAYFPHSKSVRIRRLSDTGLIALLASSSRDRRGNGVKRTQAVQLCTRSFYALGYRWIE